MYSLLSWLHNKTAMRHTTIAANNNGEWSTAMDFESMENDVSVVDEPTCRSMPTGLPLKLAVLNLVCRPAKMISPCVFLFSFIQPSFFFCLQHHSY